MGMRDQLAMALGEKMLENKGHGLSFANEYVDVVFETLMNPTVEMGMASNRAIESLPDTASWPEMMLAGWRAMLTAARNGA